MKKVFDPKRADWESLLERPVQNFEEVEKVVAQVFREVKANGDISVKKYSEMFDGFIPEDLQVSTDEIASAEAKVSPELKAAIQLAKQNITTFHTAQKTEKVSVETMAGVNCWQEKRPIQNVGLYIPGGTAPLFSTILMLAIPSKIAGCREIILCTPPGKEAEVNPVILYTAKLCGINKIYKIGGIQAIAAMTFGTETINKVYKIFGPGNQYVTVAK
ncbi:MAG: histidinol dehydrogenase, partial [Salinimicrobium sediminis]|nr:histidinol dehydrogenase [Salinimicrobium sediminis]